MGPLLAGDLGGATEACEESRRVGGRLTLGTMPSAGGGPGWCLAACRCEAGDPAGALTMVDELGDDTLAWAISVERCFNWESIALAELAVGRPDAAAAHVDRAEALAATLELDLPAAVAARTRSAVALASEDIEGARAAAARSLAGTTAAGADLQAAFSRSALAAALAAAGERTEAIHEWREAERELDRCGSVRARDQVRRELRRLGARAEPRGPGGSGDSGVQALTRRELEIAGLVTDRLTNREIAAALFLSDKTVESHIRNIFLKLGAASRVEVARAIEAERSAGPAPAGPG